MIYDQLHNSRSFSRRSRSAEFCNKGRKSTLLIWSAALLSSIASGQVPTTTALPYLLTDQAGQIRVIATSPVAPVPLAVSQSEFGSLLGGGFSVLLIEPTASAATASAIATVHKLLMMKNENAAVKIVKQYDLDATKAEANLKSKLGSTGCSNAQFSSVRLNQGLRSAIQSNHRLVTAADSSTCTLPEEEEAQEAEEELQALTESEEASQEVIEAAEAAAEAAASAASAAEIAAEATLDGIDVLESLLDALSLF